MTRVSSQFPRTLALLPYAPVEAGTVRALEVTVDYDTGSGTLSLRYGLDADMARIRVPSQRPTSPADELWKHTCFEAFIRSAGTPAYHELNFSPSTEWAAYAFEDYRKGMTPVRVPRSPAIRVGRSVQHLQLDVRFDLRTLSRPAALALAAVIEDQGGRLSYWALKHPAGKPDFHHPDSFALELSP